MIEIADLIKDGKALEILAASYFQASKYYVDSNLKWIEDKEDLSGKADILELDVLAKEFSVTSVRTTLIECKRGCTFNDIFKFSGVAKLVAADTNILICQSHDMSELKGVGEKIEINVKAPEEILSSLSSEQKQNVILFYNSNKICSLFLDKDTIKAHSVSPREFSISEKNAYNSIRGLMSELIGKVWRETDMIRQANHIKGLLDSHQDYVRSIARLLQIKPGNKPSEFYMDQSLMCQAAAFLVLKIRLSYVICAINCAIALGSGSTLPLDEIIDHSFINVVNLAKDNLELASKIPVFLQEFIYIFGGAVLLVDNDIGNLAQYMSLSVSEFKAIISLLKQLFQLSEKWIQWGFAEDMGVLSLKYVPAPLKGIGLANREQLGYSVKGFYYGEQWAKSLDIYKH